MKIYQYFSLHNNCSVTVSYADGILKSVEYENWEADINAKGIMLSAFCLESDFIEASAKHKVKVTEVQRDITFQMFYDKFDHKVGKHQAEKTWNKMSKADRVEAYDYIPAYNSWLKMKQHSRLYPSTYLNEKRWIR